MVTKIAVPGKSRPRSGLHWPQICVVPLRPLRLDQVLDDEPGARPAPGSGRRGCGAARRRSRTPARRLHVRAAVEVRVRPPPARPRPGRPGRSTRIGWVTENTHRPPGRSTRTTSRISAAESATNGTAPNAVNAMSNDPSRERQRQRVGLDQRHAYARRLCSAVTACRSMPAGQIDRDHLGALRGQPAGGGRGAGADLQDPPPGDRPEQPGVGLAQPLRAPDEVDVAQERRRARPGSRRRPCPTSAGWPAGPPRRSPRAGPHRDRRQPRDTPHHAAGCRRGLGRACTLW